jgi:hypothetical protein
MPSLKLILTIAVVSAATNVALQHYAMKRG